MGFEGKLEFGGDQAFCLPESPSYSTGLSPPRGYTLPYSNPLLQFVGIGERFCVDTWHTLSFIFISSAGATISVIPCGSPAPASQNAHACPCAHSDCALYNPDLVPPRLSKARLEFKVGIRVDVQTQWKTHVVRDSGRRLSTWANGEASG